MEDLESWMARRREEDKRLYETYGKALEASHRGEFVAIGPDGEIILGNDDLEVAQQAMAAFGSGNFALTRVGYRTIGKWLNLL